MSFLNNLDKYADLTVKIGVNVQVGQTVIVNAPIVAKDLARSITKKSYEAGAKEVIVFYIDEEINHLKFLHAPEDSMEIVHQWKIDALFEYAKDDACLINIVASDPDLLKDVDPKRIAKAQKAGAMASKEYRSQILGGGNCWNIVAHPSPSWAKKVFPEANSDEEAMSLLWDKIFMATRVDLEDPIAAWETHTNNLQEKLNFLNKKSFRMLKYTAPGTDLTVELPKAHLWVGGGLETNKGTYFQPNIPTEEVFTLPTKTGVNGTLSSTKPLSYGGNLIDNFKFTFKDGKIIEYSAEQGQEVLKNLVETDEGSHFLGEVALVPHDSPISNSNTIFYNTLFDENASCHFAIGNAVALSVENGGSMSEEELAAIGANISMTHVDFMVGCAEMDITGITHDDEEVQIFKAGNWAF